MVDQELSKELMDLGVHIDAVAEKLAKVNDFRAKSIARQLKEFEINIYVYATGYQITPATRHEAKS